MSLSELLFCKQLPAAGNDADDDQNKELKDAKMPRRAAENCGVSVGSQNK